MHALRELCCHPVLSKKVVPEKDLKWETEEYDAENYVDEEDEENLDEMQSPEGLVLSSVKFEVIN